MSDIISGTGDMSLARYIRGDIESTPEKIIQDMYDMPKSLEDYIKNHFSYLNLYELNNTLNLNIFDTELTKNYRQYLEKEILEYFYKKGVDVEEFSSFDDIIAIEGANSHIKNFIFQYIELDK